MRSPGGDRVLLRAEEGALLSQGDHDGLDASGEELMRGGDDVFCRRELLAYEVGELLEIRLHERRGCIDACGKRPAIRIEEDSRPCLLAGTDPGGIGV